MKPIFWWIECSQILGVAQMEVGLSPRVMNSISRAVHLFWKLREKSDISNFAASFLLLGHSRLQRPRDHSKSWRIGEGNNLSCLMTLTRPWALLCSPQLAAKGLRGHQICQSCWQLVSESCRQWPYQLTHFSSEPHGMTFVESGWQW